MNDAKSRVDALWSTPLVWIGMVHLPPLPGSPRWTGTMEGVLSRAADDAAALEEAGFHGVIVENYMDAPFHPTRVPPVTIAAMTRAVSRVVETVRIPVGVNVLRNDAASALSIAAVTGAAAGPTVADALAWRDVELARRSTPNGLCLRRCGCSAP